MAQTLLAHRPPHPVAILDPAVGPATFPAAVAQTGRLDAQDEITCFDVDSGMVDQVHAWGQTSPCRCHVHQQDYLEAECGGSFDLAILNPPYIRQEWIDRKEAYRSQFADRYGTRIPGTSNLYVYFLVKVLHDLKPGGTFAALVYDSWQSTRYGAWLWDFLQRQCEWIEQLPVKSQPFCGRLIDATVLFGRRRPTPLITAADSGERLARAKERGLPDIAGLVPVSTLFASCRGLRLKQADFFLGDLTEVERHGATPFIKKSAGIKGYCIPQDHPESALLASPRHADARVLRELDRRLEVARKKPEENVSILTWFRERPQSWALHREPPHAPFLFNYYLRNRPRHLYNPSRAYADNLYGLTPLYPIEPLAALALLNATCFCVEILAQARNQGSGLAKVQLYEYRQARLPDYRRFSKAGLRRLKRCGARLASSGEAGANLAEIDALIADELGQAALRPEPLCDLYRVIDQQAKTPGDKRG
jgi:adenine-specific DNA-methyltransferase